MSRSVSTNLPDPGGRGAAAGHQARHLLALPADVEIDEIETLAESRFPATRWEVAIAGYEPLFPAPSTASPGRPGVLRTSRHTTLTGPYLPAPPCPPETAAVFDVICPRERGERPWPGGGDRDGLARAFPDGLPVREESRVLGWLVAAARRLGGSVVADVGGSGEPAVLTPDPSAAIDLCLYSDVWLEPNATLAIAKRVRPGAVLATEGAEWAGPPPKIAEVPLYRGEQLTPEQRKALHEAADDFDISALSSEQILEGYGVVLDLGDDGRISVEVGGESQLPTVLRDLPWTQDGAVRYRVRWLAPDLAESQREFPSMAHRIGRSRAGEVIAKIGRYLHRAVGGELADEADFLLDPADL